MRPGCKRALATGDVSGAVPLAIALLAGFEMLTDAIRAVNVTPGNGPRAEAEMREAGAPPVRYADIAA